MNLPRTLHALLAAVVLAAPTFSALPAAAASREDARLTEATAVLQEGTRMRDQAIPDWLLRRAYGVAVFPNVVKVGLGIGGRGGRGVLVVRDDRGRWSNPAFVTLAGGSFGWQAGIQESDIVLVFTTRKSVEGITGGKFTLGADASVAVGPVGRQVSGSTDVTLDAEVYSYSRARGLFGGIAIDGTVISIDHRGNAAYYQRRGVLASEIFAADAPAAPESAQRFVAALRNLAREEAARPAQDGTAAPAAGARPATTPEARDPSPPAEARGLESGGAATFPLEAAQPPR
ncbi:MAG: lipid-binding SYLF domain-containing protein [Steroidobacteraceae bacterium]|nr:lipid-binding SYLF domain-containing protein [Steroidobacteraceae bacterium]